MKKRNIAILFGGASPEYHVSLHSAASVLAHLDQKRYQPLCIGITEQGKWFLYTGPIEKISKNQWQQPAFCKPIFIMPGTTTRSITVQEDGQTKSIEIDAVLPLLHGQNGEDGTVQGLIELTGIPLIGCGTLCSALCIDKYRAHKLASSQGINTPKTLLIHQNIDETTLFKAGEEIGYPLMVKPLRAGSSFGITKVDYRRDLPRAARLAFSYDCDAVLESYVEGVELGCAIMGNSKDSLTIGEIDEIEIQTTFFDYEAKYSLKDAQIHLPARLTKEQAEKVRQTAIALYQLFDCRGFARVDLFLTPNGDILFNEINTIPGFTEKSRFPNMMMAAGLSYTDIITQVIETALIPEEQS
ncbi:MAG: D-alanine--D-alanine ligase [Clostridiales bacterium]|nr:D-alanine--D-alanine ligase [Clostridiales bacterium]